MTKTIEVMNAIVAAFKQNPPGSELMGKTLRTIAVEQCGMHPWPAAGVVGRMVKARMLEVTRIHTSNGKGQTWMRNYRLMSDVIPESFSRNVDMGMGIVRDDDEPVDMSAEIRKAQRTGKWTMLPEGITMGQVRVLGSMGYEVRHVIRYSEGGSED